MIKNVSVGVVIPWREQNHRIKALNAMKDHYSNFFKDKEIFWADSGSEIFSRAQSINLGLKHFFDRGFDVVIVNDADTISNINSLNDAVNLANDVGEIVMPYNVYNTFNEDNTKSYPHKPSDSIDRLHPCSGSMAIPVKVYNEIGGFDENFIGWGPEDQEYQYRYFLKYNKKFTYIDGQCYSLHHGPLKLNDQIIKNHEYACKKYPESVSLSEAFKYLINYFKDKQ
jgi:hypothetical protein